MARKNSSGTSRANLRLVTVLQFDAVVEDFDWSRDGRYLVACKEDSEIIAIDTQGWWWKEVVFDETICPIAIAWHPDGDRVIFGTDCGEIHLLDVRAEVMDTISWNTGLGRIDAIVPSPSGDRLAVMSDDASMLCVYDTETHDKLFDLDGYEYGRPAWCPDGQSLVVKRQVDEIDPMHDIHDVGPYAIEVDGRTGLAQAIAKLGDMQAEPVWPEANRVLIGDVIVRGLREPPQAFQSLRRHRGEGRLSYSHESEAWNRFGWLAAHRHSEKGSVFIVSDRLKQSGAYRASPAETANRRAPRRIRWCPPGHRFAAMFVDTIAVFEVEPLVTEVRETDAFNSRRFEVDPRYADGRPPKEK